MFIKLPVSIDPLLSKLPEYSHPLSILLIDKSRNLPYLLNDYGRLAYDRESETFCNPCYDWMYTSCGALTYECGIFPTNILREPTVITDFIAAMLQNGRYCIIDIDEFYCAFSSNCQSEHKTNGVLISGIDTIERVMLINCYLDDIGYKEYKVSIGDFFQAIDYTQKQIVIHCFKENKHLRVPTFDTVTFLDMLAEYGDPDFELNGQRNYCYDSTAIRMVVDKIQSGAVPAKWLKNIAVSLREHKIIMQNRVLWLCNNERLDNYWYSLYSTILQFTEEIYDLSVQYEKCSQNILTTSKVNIQNFSEEYLSKLFADIADKLLSILETEECFVGRISKEMRENNNE